MNHNWNLIPFRWTFWNYLPFFLGHWIQDLSAPDAAIFPEFNPYILYQESWISNNILNHVVALLATFQSADTPPPVYSKPLLMDRPSTYALPLHLFSWRSPGGPFSPDILNFIRQLGISLLHSLAGVPHHLQKGITLYLTMESDKLHHIPLKGRNKES